MNSKVASRGSPILKRTRTGGRIAEIGVMCGKLSRWLLSHRPDIKLIMVDNWAGMERRSEQYLATKDSNAWREAAKMEQFKRDAFKRVSPYPERHVILHMDSDVAAKWQDNKSLDMVFLDADHSYDGVKADLQAWASKVKSGGYIGGHDYQNPDPECDFSGVERAVKEWAQGREIEVDTAYTWFIRI